MATYDTLKSFEILARALAAITGDSMCMLVLICCIVGGTIVLSLKSWDYGTMYKRPLDSLLAKLNGIWPLPFTSKGMVPVYRGSPKTANQHQDTVIHAKKLPGADSSDPAPVKVGLGAVGGYGSPVSAPVGHPPVSASEPAQAR